MASRSIETEADRQSLLRRIESHKLPFTVAIEAGRSRTTKQNKLQRQWINEIAEQMPEHSAEEWRGICKLHFGVPIMRAASEGFHQTYDEVIRPMDYETKVKLMSAPLDMPVTRLMTTRQHTEYLDAIYQHFTALGVALTDPGELLAMADQKAAA